MCFDPSTVKAGVQVEADSRSDDGEKVKKVKRVTKGLVASAMRDGMKGSLVQTSVAPL